jgi:hypothetical protein
MMNGAAISFVSKMQTLTAPSSTWAESVTLFDTSTDVIGIRNLLSELGHLQESPTTIYQDNRSAIQIANNRGSLGKNSRAMDLKTLTIRNRIEDHEVETEWLETKEMLGDMGSKALPENPFTRFRDTMNGYALVRAKFPKKALSPYVYSSEKKATLNEIQAMVMKFEYHDIDDYDSEPDQEVDVPEIQVMAMRFTIQNNGDDDEIDNLMEETNEHMVNHNEENEINMPAEYVVNENNDDDLENEVEPLPVPNINHEDVDVKMNNDKSPILAITSTETVLILPSLVFNDDWFEFDHHWSFHRLYPDIKYDLFELDDLPDPRLYGIDVKLLRNLAQTERTLTGLAF